MNPTPPPPPPNNPPFFAERPRGTAQLMSGRVVVTEELNIALDPKTLYIPDPQTLISAQRPCGAAQLMSRRVVVTEERACRLCHARIGTKMSAVFPNGLLVCYKCLRKGDPQVCPVTGVDFRDGLPGAGQRPPPAPPEEPDSGAML